MPPSVSSSTAGCSESWPRRTGSLRYMEFRDRKLCTLEGVVFNSCAIHVSPRPSSTQCRILDACGFSATLLFPTDPFSFDLSCLLGYMYHFLLPDARCIGTYLARGRSTSQPSRCRVSAASKPEMPAPTTMQGRRPSWYLAPPVHSANVVHAAERTGRAFIKTSGSRMVASQL